MQGLHLTSLLSILVLMVTAFIMPVVKRREIVIRISLTTMVVVLVMLVLVAVDVARVDHYVATIGHYDAPFGITFDIGPIEAVIGMLFAFVTTMVVWYASFGIEKEIKEGRVKLFFTLIHLLLASLLGIVFTSDLFNSFVFIEVSTLAACGLIAIKDKPENIKATMKYLILSSLGSGLVLMGIAYLYAMTGHLNMRAIHETLQLNIVGNERAILVSLTMFTIGLGIKSAMFPLHVWLPDAHASAPGPSSAILSGIVIKAPVVLLFKILFMVYGRIILQDTVILTLILIFGATGMIMGSLFARVQKDMKRMIAYSSVAQMGYIFFGFGLGNDLGMTIAIYHILAHGLTKSCLFLAVSSFIEQTGHREIDKMRGIGREMPITLAIFSLGALSMVGIPVLPGFISKWNLALASIEHGQIYLLLIILASSLLNVSYYFPIVINGYFGNANLEGKVYKSKMKPIKELIPLILLSVVMVIVGFASGPIIDWIASAMPLL
jgi:multicomponent Na+:H+ antiporter subunit D